jgi:hypothetical protein
MATENANTLVCSILEEIATTANAMRHTFGQASIEGWNIDGNTFYLFESIAEKIGWLADLGIEKISGSPDVVGGAEDWMLPPSYHVAKNVAEVNHG